MESTSAGNGINIRALAARVAAEGSHPGGHAIDAYATSGSSPPKRAAIQPIIDRCRTDDIWRVVPGQGLAHEPNVALNDLQLDRHFAGTYKIGFCPIQRGASTTRVALFDLDSHKGESSWAEMVEAARGLMVTAEMLGIVLIPFRSSGGRGIHLIAIWNAEQDARSVRAAMVDIITIRGFSNGTGGIKAKQVEIFPKQDDVPADGWGSMFVIPGSGKSAPLDPETLDVIDWGDVEWQESEPVPVVARVERAPAPVGDVDLGRVRGALFSIDPNGLGYDEWLRYLFAVHAGTGGSDEGLALMREWSSQFSRYDETETDKQWRHAKIKPGGIGVGTLFKAAREAGWRDPGALAMTGPEGFEVVAADVEGARARLQTDVENMVAIDIVDALPTMKDSVRDAAILIEHEGETALDAVRALVGDQVFEDFVAAVRAEAALSERLRERAKAEGQVLSPEIASALTRNRRGKIEATYTNVYEACARPEVIGLMLGYDEFLDEIVLSVDEGANWAAMTDADYVQIQKRLEGVGFSRVAKEVLRDVVGAVACHARRFDTAKLWLNRLHWDGTRRVGQFMSTYLGAEDTPYTRAVAHYQWTAMVGRVLAPGCQADMVPVWVGPQGAKKSSVARALVPDARFFKELSFGERDADLSRKMRGLLIGELGELRGLATRELEAVKAWITQRDEHWTPKFKEFGTTFARRCIFIGTTNQQQFLADETGERRWLPVMVGACDPAAVARDRDQLWAEAREMYLRDGIAWREAERLAEAEHDQYKVHDSWADAIHRWLDEVPPALSGEAQGPRRRRRDRPFTTGEVMEEALLITTAHQRTAEQMRVGRILRAAGFKCDKTQSRVAGDRVRYWRAPG